jgi:hypothetical protein
MNVRNQTSVVSALSGLLTRISESRYGFLFASRGVRDPVLRAEFLQYAMQRERFLTSLTDIAAHIGAGDAKAGTNGADASLASWPALENRAMRSLSAVSHCLKQDLRTLDAFERMTYVGLPERIAELIRTQHSAVGRVIERLRSLEHSLSAAEARSRRSSPSFDGDQSQPEDEVHHERS